LGGLNMKVSKVAKAGTLESNDVLIMVMPNENGGVELELESIVMKQFGKQIKKTILDKITELGVENVTIKIQDKGALDYTIKARVQTAVERAM
jgi:citrate lyase subunit gamma (acyl carrier protein)